MVKEFGTRIAIDAITDYNIDFNNDGQISSVELTMLKRSINHRGKVDEKKLKEKEGNGKRGSQQSQNFIRKLLVFTGSLFSQCSIPFPMQF